MRLMKHRLAAGLMGVIIGSAMLLSGCRLAQSAANTQAEAAAPVAVQVPKTLRPRILKRYDKQSGFLNRIRLSPDKSYFFATGSHSPFIDIFRTAGQQHITTIRLERDQSGKLETDFISNDQLFANLEYALFQVYRVPDGAKVFEHQFERNNKAIFANHEIALNGESLLYWQSGQTYTIPWAGPTTGFLGVTQDNAVLTEDMNAWVREENPATGRKVDWETTGQRRVEYFMSTPDHRYLVTVNFDGACAVWRRGDKPELVGRCGDSQGNKAIEYGEFSGLPDQYQFATTAGNRVRAYRIDPATGAPHQFFDQDMTAQVWSVALNTNGRLAVSLFDEATQRTGVEVWDIAGRRPIARYMTESNELARQISLNPDFRLWTIFRELGFSADGKLLLAIAGQSLLAFDVP
mgnify:CR=1 FL=1